ncbi:MAG: ABC transporter substrate-binding protein [Clostridiales bacterium]|nr:ABC transporter substrate-binding protein [Clostridiales bacterium]
MKIKKILAVVLSLCMIFALAACSSSTEDEEASTEEAGSSTSSEGTIKIGGIGPLTGDVAQYGVAVKLGAELAVAEINAAGGINGYQIEFKMEDDVGDAEKAVTAYGSLKDWGMQMVMGTVTSTPCISVASEAAADNMLLLTPSGSAVECLEAGDTLFRMCFSDPNQGIGAADFIADNDLATTVAIIYNSSDTYSTGIMEKFTEEAAEVGLEIVATEAFTNDSATDFSAQLTNIKETGADLLFLPIYYTPASLIISQATAMGYEPTYFGSDGMDGILGMENIDVDLIDGVMYLTPFIESSTDDATVNFVESFTAAYPDQTAYMNQFAADAYDAIYALKAAAESCSITPDMDASTVGDLMKVAMTEITIDGVTGTGITWGEDGEPNKTPRVAKIENGEIVAA